MTRGPGRTREGTPRFGRLAIAAAVGVLVLAGTQLGSAKVDFLPEFMPPAVQVQTEALGLSAAEVEQLITVPLEQDLLNGVPWLDHIHSRSQSGLSAIDVVFEPGTELYAARQMVQERLTQAHALPNVGSAPVMVEPLASASRVSMIGLTSKSVSLIDMSVLARWKVRPRLMGIPGVANVSVYGMRDRQLQIQADPATLSSKGVTLTQVIETAGNALWVSPLTFVEASTPGTGGFVEGQTQRLAVQHILPITTADTLGQVTIEGTTPPLKLSDVTKVIEDHQPLIGDAVNADPTLFLVVQKFPGADTAEVTRSVEEAMASLAPGLGGITVDTSVYRPATYLESATRSIGLTGGLALLVLLLGSWALFRSWRPALVVGAAVTVTLAGTFTVLYLLGETFTSITLSAMLVATVVTFAVATADVDGVRAQARAQEQAPHRLPPGELVARTLRRTLRNTAVALLVGALALTPTLALGPSAAAFSRPLVAALALSMGVGLVVSLTLTPALTHLLMQGPPRPEASWASLRRATDAVRRVAERFSQSHGLAWAAAGVLLLVALTALPQLSSTSLVPQARDRDVLLTLQAAPGTSLPEMNRIAGLMASKLQAVDGVTHVAGHNGRAVTSDQLGDVNAGELWLRLDDAADYGTTRAAIDRVAHGFPGVRVDQLTYTQDRLAAATAGGEHGVMVRVLGQDLPSLRATAEQVADQLSEVSGLSAARVLATPMQPTVRVEVDLDAAKRYDLRPGDVRREATTLVSGLTVGNLYEQAKVFDVVVLGTPTARANLSTLADVRIDTPSGKQVRLGDVAKLSVGPEPASIVHDQVMRSVEVVAEVTGSDAQGVLDDVRTAAARVSMPSEAHLQVIGNAVDRQSDLRRVGLVALGVLIAILLVLQAAIGRWRPAALLLLLAPLGGAGSIGVAPLVGGFGTLGPMLGFLTVTLLTLVGGLATVRSLQFEAEEANASAAADGSPIAVAAARSELTRSRIVPVVRTALITALALLPAVVLGDRAGSEVFRPFALTVIGGLVTSVLVVLLVVPALCADTKEVDR
ncbi:efflux RND transporter permease subunit [Terrabacter sp. AAH1]